MYDQDTEQIMKAAELTDSQTRSWFNALCETATGADGEPPNDWTTFKVCLEETAQVHDSSFDASFVQTFCMTVESAGVNDPLGTLKEMSGRGAEELAAVYPTLQQQDVSTLYWVTEEQQAQLTTGIGDHWPDVVCAKLDEVWAPWRESDAETLADFLDQWMETILAEANPAAAEPDTAEPAVAEETVESLHWVTVEQHERLNIGIGDLWPDTVRTKLDEVWSPWRESDAATLTAFLDEWMDTILGEASAATTAPGLEQFDEETQAALVSDEGQAAVDELRRQVDELLEANPEFAEIDPARRQELILQAAAEQMKD